MNNVFPKLRRRPGTKPTQFRLDESFMNRLDELVAEHSKESGMEEDRTSVIRRLIAAEHLRRVSTGGVVK